MLLLIALFVRPDVKITLGVYLGLGESSRDCIEVGVSHGSPVVTLSWALIVDVLLLGVGARLATRTEESR